VSPPDRLQEAADLLMGLWRDGHRIDSLPAHLRPTTRAEGYAIQSVWERRSPKPLFGWKIAATSAAGQAHVKVDGPMAGRILAETVVRDGGTSLWGVHMRVAEAEFCFRIGRDLPPRDRSYTVDEVMAAVDALHPAIEIPDSRYEDFTAVGAPQLIADNACGHRFVLGPAAPSGWRDLDLARHTVRGIVQGRPASEGIGSNVLGDPRIALAWLANELSAHGLTLRSGQVATTGTCVTPMPIEPGDRVSADFGPLGRVGVSIAA
jgi:2-keto-4-pentenoate hydratase